MELRVPAIEIQQSPGRKLYSFAIDGREVHKFATVSRVKRSDGRLAGYQRPEVVSHIAEIRDYIESESPMIPNAVVLAFDSRVKFVRDRSGPSTDYSCTGTLVIPVDEALPPEERVAFIVDGQQRLAAVREADVERFPLCVSAFITDDVRHQTEQFILVNATKPLPKGLLYELLPTTGALLPGALHKRRLSARILERLNTDSASPFFGLIQTPTNPAGRVKDNSILRMLDNSLSDGALYRFRGETEDEADIDSMMKLLSGFWGAVSRVFNDAWSKPPKLSRLVHGAGIVSMGFVMDAIADRYRHKGIPDARKFEENIRPLKVICRWTDGLWDFGGGQRRKWNELQNTSKDIELLINHLVASYKRLVCSTVSSRTQRQSRFDETLER